MNRREFLNKTRTTGLIAGGGITALAVSGSELWHSMEEKRKMALSFIKVDKAKCRHCRKCQQDCLAGILREAEDGTPFMTEGGSDKCYRCQHCMTVCPSGALSWQDKNPEESLLPGELPDPILVQNLLRQRRSIRAYKKQNVDSTIIQKLQSTVDFAPTGCNDRQLFFSYSDDIEITNRFRTAASKAVLKLIQENALPKKIAHFAGLKKGLAAGKDIFFRTAPHFVAISVGEKAKDWYIDPYIAAAQFEILASSFRLGTCWGGMATDLFSSVPDLYDRLSIPNGYRLAIMILFGYPAVQYSRLPQHDPYKTISLKFDV